MTPRVINYSAAYSFAHAVISAVNDPASQGLDDATLPDFFGFRTAQFFARIASPQKSTLIHEFIYQINSFPIQHYVGKVDGEIIVADFGPVLDGAAMERPAWFVEAEVALHLEELRALLDAATRTITEAAFQLLFADRTFLFKFSVMLSRYVAQLQPGEHECVVRTGEVRRSYLPAWLKNAIFHRDQGRCQLCGCDLTNLLVPTEARHLDHMVPLKASGTNDPTNFQLTCGSCNTSKAAQIRATDHFSYPFWEP
jgi:hypothetical protein